MERILVPLDGSERAEAILPQIRRQLSRTEAEIVLLTSVFSPPDFHLQLPGMLEEARAYLRRTADRLNAQGLRCRTLVEAGPAASAILEVARREEISLVAMSTHGRTGLSRWAFGSVAEKVIRSSPQPVLVVRSFRERSRQQEVPFRNILVPVDGREASLSVLPAVLSLARPVDAHVTLICVHEASAFEGRWESADAPVAHARQAMIDACIPMTTEIRHGDPASEILKAADERSIDLIAMATHGRSGPSRWVLGSVTEKVLRASTVPIVVARRKKELERAEESAPSVEFRTSHPA
jgi:nucleotide-binding universal stress UspA family protein